METNHFENYWETALYYVIDMFLVMLCFIAWRYPEPVFAVIVGLLSIWMGMWMMIYFWNMIYCWFFNSHKGQ